jgi:hypothetical protein
MRARDKHVRTKKFQVTSVMTISVVTFVEARSAKAAKDEALGRGVQTLCHQCEGDGPSKDIWQEWRVAIDGEPDSACVEVNLLEDE